MSRRKTCESSPSFLGSGFGGKLWPWTQSALAAAAARQLGKPVKLVLTRQMCFQSAGHRPRTQQRLRLSAEPDGKLTSLRHDFVTTTSLVDDYKEDCGEATPFLYSVPNLRVTGGLTRRNTGVPTSMRGPGAVPGLFALESAMDELAIQLKVDPVQLRLINEPSMDEGLKLPFSSRHLKECLTTGADRFGWSKRKPEVGSMKRDGITLGWGMAACTWIAERVGCRGDGRKSATIRRHVFPAAPRILAPARTQFSRRLWPTGSVLQSTASRWCWEIRHSHRARFPVGRWRPPR